MEQDKIAYITELAAQLSPDSQDKLIRAIKQLLVYERKEMPELVLDELPLQQESE